MARKRRGGGTSQSQFIRALFAANPNTKLSDARTAWAEAGNKGVISNSLFYVVKGKAGFTKPSARGKRRGRPPGSKTKSLTATPRTAEAKYEAVENLLDDVIQMLWTIGDTDLVAE